MTFCDKHFERFKPLMVERGLSKFIAEDGVNPASLEFEPIMMAMGLLCQLSDTVYGQRMMVKDAETGKTPCPICMLERTDWAEYASFWVRGRAEQLEFVSQEPKILMLGDQ